jgi:hypothetical protein
LGSLGREVAAGEVQYLVLPDVQNPWLLARVRWPDVFQAISPARPDWQADPGLFDLPYDPSGVRVTRAQAEVIAGEWGSSLPGDDQGGSSGGSFIRRMPANWSHLTPAERRAWSVQPEPRARARRSSRHRDAGTGEPGEVPAVIDLRPVIEIDLTDAAGADVTWTDYE